MKNIKDYVSALPECYQLIYGHPELEITTSRNCQDRLIIVESIVSKLYEKLQRPLRILDLGCAQGFFSLSLAKYCSKVKGVDFLDKNIELCRALAGEFAFENVEFCQDMVQNVIQSIDYDEYDIVLGFSIFHHVCHSDGFFATQHLINTLANKAGIVLLELAVKEEGLYWAEALPQQAQEILGDIAFCRKLGEFGTHLTTVSRPLFIASSKYWFINDQIEPINAWSRESHEFSHGIHQDSRRYYWSDDKFLKVYDVVGPMGITNQEDIRKEVANFAALKQCRLSKISLADLYYNDEEDGKGYLVYEKMPGIRLSQMIASGMPYDQMGVYRQVLEQLCELEQHHYYHNDLRVWNLLVDGERVSLIDISSVCSEPRDIVWPYNVYLSFIIFLNEVARNKEPATLPHRSPLFLFFWPQSDFLKIWLAKIWSTPAGEWSFAVFKQFFDSIGADESAWALKPVMPAIPAENIILWMSANEALFKNTALVRDYLDKKDVPAPPAPEADTAPADEQDNALLEIVSRQEIALQQLLAKTDLLQEQLNQLAQQKRTADISLSQRIARKLKSLLHS